MLDFAFRFIILELAGANFSLTASAPFKATCFSQFAAIPIRGVFSIVIAIKVVFFCHCEATSGALDSLRFTVFTTIYSL